MAASSTALIRWPQIRQVRSPRKHSSLSFAEKHLLESFGSVPAKHSRIRRFQVSKVYSILGHFPVRLLTASIHFASAVIRSRYSSLIASARRGNCPKSYFLKDNAQTRKT